MLFRSELSFVSSHLQLGHAFERGAWYLRPLLDGGFTYVNTPGFSESGAGGANLMVKSRSETSWSLEPALEIGAEMKLTGGPVLRPYIKAGLLHFFSGTTPKVSASFQGAPAGVGGFNISGRTDRNFGDISLGAEIINLNGANIKIGYSGQFSQRSNSHGGMIKFALPF